MARLVVLPRSELHLHTLHISTGSSLLWKDAILRKTLLVSLTDAHKINAPVV